MPIQRAADYYLAGKPYMLTRDQGWKGRAWHRGGEISVPGFPTTRTEAGIENFPEQIEFNEVWDDWSGGYGFAYRGPENANTYHWGENIDTRWPHQMTHAQQMRQNPWSSAVAVTLARQNIEFLIDTPAFGVGTGPAGFTQVIGLANGINGDSVVGVYSPAGYATFNVDFATASMSDRRPGYRPAIYGSYLFVGDIAGSAFSRFRISDQAATINVDVPPLAAHGFMVAGNRLWRAHGPPMSRRAIHLQSAANADSTMTIGGWSATISVGNLQSGIVDMIALNDQLFVGKAEGLYAGDQSGTFYNVTGDLGNASHPDNFRDLTTFNGGVVFPHVTGLYRYRKTQANVGITVDIGPAGQADRSNRSPISGRIRTTKGMGGWLYAGLWSGSASYILAGRETGEDSISWHTMQRLPNFARIHRMHFAGFSADVNGSATPAYLFVSTDPTLPAAGATSPLYVIPLPTNNGNPLLSDPVFSANYIGSARLDMGSTDRGAPGARKLYRLCEVWGESFLSGAQYADIYYTIDRGVRTLLGRAQTSPVSYLYFPSTAGSFTLGRQIEMSVESFTASVNTTPVYRSLVVRGAILADVVDVITAQTIISDDVRDRQGNSLRPAGVQIQELRSFASPSFGPIPMEDLLGVTQYVKVLPPIEEREIYQAGNENPEILATVRMSVLSYTAA